jgi:hypothetical protein
VNRTTEAPQGALVVTETPVVALGVALTLQLGPAQSPLGQVVFQTHMDRDAPPAVQAHTLDRLYIAGRRLQHSYRLQDLEAILKSHAVELEQIAAQEDAAARQLAADDERRAAALEQAQQDDEAAWHSSGKRGLYTPSTGAVQRAKALRAEQEKAHELHTQMLQGNAGRRAQIARQKEGINSEVADIQAFLDAVDS